MGTPGTFVVKYLCNAGMQSSGGGTTADGDHPAVLRLARIRIAIVMVVLPFSHSFVGNACWVPFWNSRTEREENPRLGERRRTRSAEDEEGMASVPE